MRLLGSETVTFAVPDVVAVVIRSTGLVPVLFLVLLLGFPAFFVVDDSVLFLLG